jgi:hypothetical protein
MRKIPISNEAKKSFKKGEKKKEILSIFPCDKPFCACFSGINEIKKSGVMPAETYHCPHDPAGYKKYIVTCANCGEKVGEVMSTDEKLSDWYDFHYYSWYDKKEWHGAFGINISPLDANLGIECCCGQDTRDFRPNQTLAGAVRFYKISETMQGREWGKALSKFKLEEVK